MAISQNGSALNSTKTTGTTLATSATLAKNTGDVIVVAFSGLSGSGTYSVSDTENTYSVLANVSNGTTITTYLWWAVSLSGTAQTVTVTHPSMAARCIIAVSYTGWTGTPTIDLAGQTATGTGTSGTLVTGTSAHADGLWVGGGGANGPTGADGQGGSGTGVASTTSANGPSTSGGGASSNCELVEVWSLNAAAGTGSLSEATLNSRAYACTGATIYDAAGAATDGFVIASASSSGYYPLGNQFAALKEKVRRRLWPGWRPRPSGVLVPQGA